MNLLNCYDQMNTNYSTRINVILVQQVQFLTAQLMMEEAHLLEKYTIFVLALK